MNTLLVSTSTTRQRGQLTIPMSIRKKLSWVQTGVVVKFRIKDAKTLSIEPYHNPHS